MQPGPLTLTPDVVHETIDGEAILINLATGTYFSLEGSGAEVWALFVKGATVDEAAATLAAAHGADETAVRAEVARLARDLAGHGLVSGQVAEVPAGAGSLGTFVAPALGVFTDMEEFLLVDPIHEVEPEKGWPHVAPAA